MSPNGFYIVTAWLLVISGPAPCQAVECTWDAMMHCVGGSEFKITNPDCEPYKQISGCLENFRKECTDDDRLVELIEQYIRDNNELMSENEGLPDDTCWSVEITKCSKRFPTDWNHIHRRLDLTDICRKFRSEYQAGKNCFENLKIKVRSPRTKNEVDYELRQVKKAKETCGF